MKYSQFKKMADRLLAEEAVVRKHYGSKYELIMELTEAKSELEEAQLKCDNLHSANIVMSVRNANLAMELAEARQELVDIVEFLDTLGDIAHGDSVLERVEALMRYYAAQIGRWTKGILRREKSDTKEMDRARPPDSETPA